MDDSTPVAAEPASPSPGSAVPPPEPPLRLRARVFRWMAGIWLAGGIVLFLGPLAEQLQQNTPLSEVLIYCAVWSVLLVLLVGTFMLRWVAAGCLSSICVLSLSALPFSWMMSRGYPLEARVIVYGTSAMLLASVPIASILCWNDLKVGPGSTRNEKG